MEILVYHITSLSVVIKNFIDLFSFVVVFSFSLFFIYVYFLLHLPKELEMVWSLNLSRLISGGNFWNDRLWLFFLVALCFLINLLKNRLS